MARKAKIEPEVAVGRDVTRKRKTNEMKKHLFVLLASLFVVMIGLGIATPVLPFYVERLALVEGASRELVVIHVGLLTGVYALRQLGAYCPRLHCQYRLLTWLI